MPPELVVECLHCQAPLPKKAIQNGTQFCCPEHEETYTLMERLGISSSGRPGLEAWTEEAADAPVRVRRLMDEYAALDAEHAPEQSDSATLPSEPFETKPFSASKPRKAAACGFCGEALSLMARLRGAEFCSESHLRAFEEQQAGLLVERLRETAPAPPPSAVLPFLRDRVRIKAADTAPAARETVEAREAIHFDFGSRQDWNSDSAPSAIRAVPAHRALSQIFSMSLARHAAEAGPPARSCKPPVSRKSPSWSVPDALCQPVVAEFESFSLKELAAPRSVSPDSIPPAEPCGAGGWAPDPQEIACTEGPLSFPASGVRPLSEGLPPAATTPPRALTYQRTWRRDLTMEAPTQRYFAAPESSAYPAVPHVEPPASAMGTLQRTPVKCVGLGVAFFTSANDPWPDSSWSAGVAATIVKPNTSCPMLRQNVPAKLPPEPCQISLDAAMKFASHTPAVDSQSDWYAISFVLAPGDWLEAACRTSLANGVLRAAGAYPLPVGTHRVAAEAATSKPRERMACPAIRIQLGPALEKTADAGSKAMVRFN